MALRFKLPPRFRHWIVNAFLGVLLFFLVVDSLPTTSFAHGYLRNATWFRRPLNFVGVWQGSWNLFAPDVDRTNGHLEAYLIYTEGEEIHWRSPDWSKMAPAEKFLHVRHMKWMDQLANEENAAAWPEFAEYLIDLHREEAPPGERVIRVELWRHWGEIPPPNPKQDHQPLSKSAPHDQAELFHMQDFE